MLAMRLRERQTFAIDSLRAIQLSKADAVNVSSGRPQLQRRNGTTTVGQHWLEPEALTSVHRCSAAQDGPL